MYRKWHTFLPIINLYRIPKMIADELATQTTDLVRCDMSLEDILTDPEPDYTPTEPMIEAMDTLSSKMGDSGADTQIKDLAGKTSFYICMFTSEARGGTQEAVSNFASICGLQ